MGRILKKDRHAYLIREINKNPFLKDEDLAKACHVSVSTIRFDRAELGIAEYRERVRDMAQGERNNQNNEGELLEIHPFRDGISILETDVSMLFENTNVVRSQCIYALAENLALQVIRAKSALVKVANVKYIKEVLSGERLVAKSEVIRVRRNEYIVHVFIKANLNEVFRGKFSLAVIDSK